jgi:hypothetical protein
MHILADVSGYTAVQKVIAYVKKHDSPDVVPVEMVLNAEGKYEATCPIEEASAPVGEEYSVVVEATDADGAKAESAPVTVTVPDTEPTAASLN